MRKNLVNGVVKQSKGCSMVNGLEVGERNSSVRLIHRIELDGEGNIISQSQSSGKNGARPVYPGELVTYEAWAEIVKPKKEPCTVPVEVSKVLLIPSSPVPPAENEAEGDPIALSATDFFPSSGGKFTPADLKAKGNSVTFLLWKTSISAYELTMEGTARCFKQTHSVAPRYTINVPRPDPILGGGCKVRPYQDNNVMEVDCSIDVSGIEKAPEVPTRYGFLQLAQADVRSNLGPILEFKTNALDCREEVSGKCEKSIDIRAGGLGGQTFSTKSSLFMTPYSSASS